MGKFNYLSLETGETKVDKKENVETLGSELIHRGQSSESSNSKEEETKTVSNDNKKVVKKDPLKWFGFLVPNSMRLSQRHFSKAIELSVEAANVQSEIRAVF